MAPFDSRLLQGGAKSAPIAVLGPTNTGKTHYAIERMLAYETGMIGLPLRLLAREVFDQVVATRGAKCAALITGEEKIVPPKPRFWICTVEAMPLAEEVAFLAVDEIQLAADLERGRTFTSRLFHARGSAETLFLGSETMRPILRSLFPGLRFQSRERLSTLAYAGPKKVSRLPHRSAVVSFSAESVYAAAELIRRQRGGAAVILGALSPRTRNAQAALYQSGEVDYLVATDAIGMGLNMDIDHVAFASRRKFDGRHFRDLKPDELAQIAGRAGRFMRDGTFGVTGDCQAFEDEVVAAIEEHAFEPARALQWRAERLNFASLSELLQSLNAPPPRAELQRARLDDDELALGRLTGDPEIADIAARESLVSLLWEVCQIPDFRKTSTEQHARLVGDIYLQLTRNGRISSAWLEPRVSGLDRTDGDIDAISQRIAHIRTWTFLSHRQAWLEDAAYWQERARGIEDTLSDALHEKLTQRFVDRRTSVLLRKLKDDAPLLAGVSEDGEVIVEGQFVGRLMGFEFIVDPRARGLDAKRMRAAADRALAPVLAARAAALANAKSDELQLRDEGVILWRGAPVATLAKGPTALRPNLMIHGLDVLSPHLRGRISDRIKEFFSVKVEALLGELIALGQAANAGEGTDQALSGQARGVAFRLVENFGAMSRSQFGEELKQLGQDERAKLRNLGVRFGEYTLFMPKLLKPGPAKLLTLLWALWTDHDARKHQPPKAGLVSLPAERDLPHAYYYASGYRPSGARAVRIDMLERLAGQIRAQRDAGGLAGGFEATQQLMSLVGCSGEDFESILTSLGYRKQTVKVRAQRGAPLSPEAPASPDAAPPADAPETQSADEVVTPALDSEAPDVSPADMDADAAVQPEPETAVASPDFTPPQSGGGGDPDVTPAAIEAAATDMPAADANQPPAVEAAASASAGGDERAEIEKTIWRMAPRRPPKPKPERREDRSRARPTQTDRRPERGRRTERDEGRPDGPRQSPRRDGPRREAPRRRDEAQRSPLMTMPQHRKVADPSSPFAVLASLKDELTKQQSDDAKEPETAK